MADSDPVAAVRGGFSCVTAIAMTSEVDLRSKCLPSFGVLSLPLKFSDSHQLWTMEETSPKALDASRVLGCIPGDSLLAIVCSLDHLTTCEPQSYWYIADDIVYRLLSVRCRIDLMCKFEGTSIGVDAASRSN